MKEAGGSIFLGRERGEFIQGFFDGGQVGVKRSLHQTLTFDTVNGLTDTTQGGLALLEVLIWNGPVDFERIINQTL
jgi:hypothetical protein